MNSNQLIKKISFATFSEIVSVAPRKVRESLYSHYGVKNKSRSILTSLKDKKDQKFKQLHDILQGASTPKEQEFLKELFRNWLFHKRPLLKETLDFLGVANDNGLIESEVDFFKDLSSQQVADLTKHLKGKFPTDDILIYLTFMEVPHLDKHLA